MELACQEYDTKEYKQKHKSKLNESVKVNTLVSHMGYLNFISLPESGYANGGLLKYSQVSPGKWHDGTGKQLITKSTHNKLNSCKS